MGGDLYISGEVIVVCLLVVCALLALMLLRRRAITKGQSVTLVAVASGEGWKLGIARFTTHDVAWYPLLGVSLRPRMRWVRGDLMLDAPQSLDGYPRPLTIVDPVQVLCHCGGVEVRIALASGDYTALRSWSESAPPGLNANVA